MARDYFIFPEVLLLNGLTKLNQVEICLLSQTALSNPSNENPWENASVISSFNLTYQVHNWSETELASWDSMLEFAPLPSISLSCSRIPLKLSFCSLTLPLWLWHVFLSFLPPAVWWPCYHLQCDYSMSLSKALLYKLVRFGVRFYISRMNNLYLQRGHFQEELCNSASDMSGMPLQYLNTTKASSFHSYIFAPFSTKKREEK